jgi:hypothetical protein
MCLTPEAYRERKWGHYPALRQALENKKIPSHYYGFTSASDNMFESMGRLIQISVLAVEYKDHIRETSQSVGREDMYRDLQSLEEQLEDAARFFKRRSEEVRQLYTTL